MRWFFFQFQLFKRFGFNIAFLIQAFMLIEFVHHLDELLLIDDSADYFWGTTPAWFVKIPMVQHIAFPEIISLEAFPELVYPLNHIGPSCHVPNLFGRYI